MRLSWAGNLGSRIRPACADHLIMISYRNQQWESAIHLGTDERGANQITALPGTIGLQREAQESPGTRFIRELSWFERSDRVIPEGCRRSYRAYLSSCA